MADKIGLETGDEGTNVGAGKGIQQSANENRNVVNNYIDRNNPEPRKRNQPITLEERLDRLEVSRNETERTLTRIVSLLDGNPSYQTIGIFDKLSTYIKANEDWKAATEKRVLEIEDEKSEKKIILTPSVAALSTIIALLFLVVIWLASHYLQTAGVRGAGAPVLPFMLNIAPSIAQGTLWKYLINY